MEWLGIPWWVWVFVIPELAIGVIWALIAGPAMLVAYLIERRRERRRGGDVDR